MSKNFHSKLKLKGAFRVFISLNMSFKNVILSWILIVLFRGRQMTETCNAIFYGHRVRKNPALILSLNLVSESSKW